MSEIFLNAALAAAVGMFALWLLSLFLRDASIVDVAWGPGFAVIAAVTAVQSAPLSARGVLLLALVTLWALRLGAFLFVRNHGRGEDPRYQAMRRHWGARFPQVSLLTVFALQGVLMWWISLPLQVGIAGAGAHAAACSIACEASALHALNLRDAFGVLLFATGFTFEALGDFQLARFRATPENAGRVCERGLWAYTRHPNYFGDALAHWGFFTIALGSEGAIFTALSPALMTFMLLRVSGVALLERSIGKRRPAYAAYQQRVSAFFPWRRARNAAGSAP